MKKILVGLVVAIMALAATGYFTGYIAHTQPYEKRVSKERIKEALVTMNLMTENFDGDYIQNNITKDRMHGFNTEWAIECQKIDDNNPDDSVGKSLSSLCNNIMVFGETVEAAASNNGGKDIPQLAVEAIKVQTSYIDDEVDTFARICDYDELSQYAQKKLGGFTNRFN